MALTDELRRAMDDWLLDLEEKRRSPDTVLAYRSALGLLAKWLEADTALHDLTTLRVPTFIEYVESLKDPQRKPALHHHTILAYIGVIVRWLQDLVDQGVLTTGIPNQRGRIVTPAGVRDTLSRMVAQRNASKAPRIPDLRDLPNYYPEMLATWLTARSRVVPLPTDVIPFREYLSLLRNQALIGALFSTGGRINEILSLDAAQVRRGTQIRNAVHIEGKGRKQRPLRLDADARTWIGQYLDAREPVFGNAPALFISHGPRGAGKRLTDVSGWRIVKSAADALADQRMLEGASQDEIHDLRAVSPHSIRHYVAQAMLDEGADYKDIAAILGHSSALVTETVYARLDDTRMLEIADTFAPRRARSKEAQEPDQE